LSSFGAFFTRLRNRLEGLQDCLEDPFASLRPLSFDLSYPLFKGVLGVRSRRRIFSQFLTRFFSPCSYNTFFDCRARPTAPSKIPLDVICSSPFLVMRTSIIGSRRFLHALFYLRTRGVRSPRHPFWDQVLSPCFAKKISSWFLYSRKHPFRNVFVMVCAAI